MVSGSVGRLVSGMWSVVLIKTQNYGTNFYHAIKMLINVGL